MAKNKPKLTVTGHYLHQKWYPYVIEKPVPSYAIPKNRRSIGRLSWNLPTGSTYQGIFVNLDGIWVSSMR